MKFKISHLVKTYPITFFAVIALFTASAVTAAKGVLLPPRHRRGGSFRCACGFRNP